MIETCADCGNDNASMLNAREVRGGLLWLKIKHIIRPGYLCVKCWKLANPVLFPRSKLTAMQMDDQARFAAGRATAAEERHLPLPGEQG